MPALRLLGRKWLAASDDLVFPSIFELLFRFIWLILTALACEVTFPTSWNCHVDGWSGGTFVRVYLGGVVALQGFLLVLLGGLACHSSRGTMTDTDSRKYVAPLLTIKVAFILPEILLNIMGTVWIFCKLIPCAPNDEFSKIVIQGIVVFNWVIFALTIFGLFIVFDPLGSVRYGEILDTPSQSRHHKKVTGLWSRRFRWACCCLKKDEYGDEAFQQVAALLSAIFRTTDLVPSDLMAGCVLLRVRQKRETREMRRIQMINEEEPIYSTDIDKVFSEVPTWMNLKDALHFLKFSTASYGWPYAMFLNCFTGICKLARYVTCCGCCRPKSRVVTDDNCCMCNLAAVQFLSDLPSEDILFASFKNHVFELPFCVIADHTTKNIVVAIRGSMSLRDVFTDLTAGSERFEAQGLPPDTSAHKGMAMGANKLFHKLHTLLERAFYQYPRYSLIITGHSLGAGVAVLLALKLRPKYPDLRVYAFSTPGGILSRDAARYTESFVFTVGIGDDLVMRLSVDSAENLRTKIMQTIHATKLPKYRIMLNGFGYALFGVPARDLESTWRDPEDLENTSAENGHDSLLTRTFQVSGEAALLSRNVFQRRFSKVRLYSPGRILHIVRRKRVGIEKKVKIHEPTYEMRWACPEDFMELSVMPKMLLDHFPNHVHSTLETVLNEKQEYQITHM